MNDVNTLIYHTQYEHTHLDLSNSVRKFHVRKSLHHILSVLLEDQREF